MSDISKQNVSYANFSFKFNEVKYFVQRMLDVCAESWKYKRSVNLKEFEVWVFSDVNFDFSICLQSFPDQWSELILLSSRGVSISPGTRFHDGCIHQDVVERSAESIAPTISVASQQNLLRRTLASFRGLDDSSRGNVHETDGRRLQFSHSHGSRIAGIICSAIDGSTP